MKESCIPYRGILFEKLVMKNPKVAEEYLNLHIDSVNTSDCDTSLTNFNSAIKIDFTPFNKLENVNSSQESLSTYKMLEERNVDLIKHPVTETFIHLKWQKLNWLFYLSILLRLLFATLTTISVLMSFQQKSSNAKYSKNVHKVKIIWAMVASYIPLFIIFALNIFRNYTLYIIPCRIPFLCNKRFTKLSKEIIIPIPNFRFILQISILSLLIALVATIEIDLEKYQASISHVAVWLLSFSWIEVVFKLGEHPCLGIYIYLLTRVAKDVLMFLFSIICLLIAYGSVSLLLYQPVNNFGHALYSSLNMIVGRFDLVQQNSLNGNQENIDLARFPGTTEAIFLFSFLVITICTFNILVGLAMINVKEILIQKEDFKIAQMITNSYEIEDTFEFISKVFSKFGCGKYFITKPFQLLKNEDSSVVYVSTDLTSRIRNPRHSLLNSTFGGKQVQKVSIYRQCVTSSSMLAYSITPYTIPGHVVDNARPILGLIQKYLITFQA